MKNFFKSKLFLTLTCIIGFLLLLILVVFLVVYIGKCSIDSNRQVRSTVEATVEPTATPLPDRNYDMGTPIDFEPDLSLMDLGTVDEELMEEYAQETWLDITPETVALEVDCVIMKHFEKRCTYLYYDGTYLRLDEGSDGYGVLDMILCDLNFDGSKELIYSYSFGAGDEYCSKLGWYDFESGTLSVSDFSLQGEELALYTSDGVSCELYRADRSSGENDGGYVLHLIETTPFGIVMEQGGKLFLQLTPLQ
ncbi:MAG: hypothetical protein Q4C01_06055 [Clostridia bacterium]|nr:hypothetical protein [Clostridia bacterium]